MLIASIDLQNGQAVQLRQGKDLVLTADTHPLDLVERFNRTGEVAVIDLDAALGKGDNVDLIKQLCQQADVRVGGGIRDVDKGRALLRAGAKKLIIGTAATSEFLQQFNPAHVMVALDQSKDGTVLDSGWTRDTGEALLERAERLAPYCSGYLCTFVEAEGGLGGLPVDAVQRLKKALPHPVTVAGGVSSTENAAELCRLNVDVQVGMALYQGLLDPTEVVVQSVDFAKGELVPTITQDEAGNILMVANSTESSLRDALNQGKGIYWSRSRQALWEKGATSGHTQQLLSARYDCDRDALRFVVRQQGGACHTGADSCFGDNRFTFETLFDILSKRKANPPEGSYTATLFANRHKLDKKIIEEAFEATQATTKEERIWEIADAMFFLSMLAVDEGIAVKDLLAELRGRHR